MIRPIKIADKLLVAEYLVNKLHISFPDAKKKVKKIIKSGLPNFLLEGNDLTGICYVESHIINGNKIKYVEILCQNWRIAEKFIQVLRWTLNGDYFFSLPKHDFLNRTYNKQGLRFVRCEGDRNIYNYRFEKRTFINYKTEDTEE